MAEDDNHDVREFLELNRSQLMQAGPDYEAAATGVFERTRVDFMTTIKYFISKILRPINLICMTNSSGEMRYDAVDDLINVLQALADGGALRGEIEEPSAVATSVASHTYTATEDVDLVCVNHVNNTRSWEASLWITRSGGTIRELTYFPVITTALILAQQTAVLMPGTYFVMPRLGLRTGDIVTVVDETFVAADSVLTVFVVAKRPI